MIKLTGPLLSKFDASSKVASDLNGIIGSLVAKDSTLWGADTEAPTRLNWLDLPTSSLALLPQLAELETWAINSGLNNFILCGMGGSSLAPEVFAKTFKRQLTVLDSTDPDQILAAIPTNLAKTLVIVGSKSGSTVETSSQKALFENLFTEAGLSPVDHLVVITDPGSPLDEKSRESGLRVINADPNVGGRYSALSAFGLTPAKLMGIDIEEILNQASQALTELGQSNSTAIKVATLIIEQAEQNISFNDSTSKVPGLSDWIEQLIAESTGKNQRGRLPIVIESDGADVSGSALRISFAPGSSDLIVEGELGEQFIFWELVTALLGRALNVDPFNQPNVTEAKDRTNGLLELWGKDPIPLTSPKFEDENIQIFGNFPGESALEILEKFLMPESTYIAVMAYLTRGVDDEVLKLRELLAERTKRGVTFGWGPRFLHSTGQFHKGGQLNGVFIQITGENHQDLSIPNRDFSFHKLLMAQALGDGEALTSRDLPLLRIHLKNRKAGIAEILKLFRSF
jgi:glucose-6-phosphate isomerase